MPEPDGFPGLESEGRAMNNETPQVEQPVVTTMDPNDVAQIVDTAKPVDDEHKPTESAADSADEDDASSEDKHEPDPATLPKGVVRKLNKAAKKAADAERTAREATLERDLLREQLRNYQPQQQQQVEPARQQANGEKTREDFDYDDDAYIDYRAEQKVVRLLSEREQQVERGKRQQAFAEKVTAFIAEHPDYEAIVSQPHVPLTMEVSSVIYETDNPPAVAFYLATHLEEASAIAQMTPSAMARAIGRIEAKLAVPASTDSGKPTRNVSQAPPPVTTIQSAAPVAKALEDIVDMDEYAAKRNQQRKAAGLAR